MITSLSTFAQVVQGEVQGKAHGPQVFGQIGTSAPCRGRAVTFVGASGNQVLNVLGQALKSLFEADSLCKLKMSKNMFFLSTSPTG